MAVGSINSGPPNMLPPANNSAVKPANPQDAGKLQDALKGPGAGESRLKELQQKLAALEQRQKDGTLSPADRMDMQSIKSELAKASGGPPNIAGKL
jgi:hypothetical protein